MSLRWLQNSDAFRRIRSEFSDGWATGGVISLGATVLMFLLFVFEFRSFLTTTAISDVQMSGNADDLIRINFNITMTNLPCQFASVDVVDVLGTRKLNVTRNVRRWKVVQNGDLRVAEMHDNQGSGAAAPAHDKEGLHPEDPVQRAQALNAKNFDDYVKNNELVLVNFFAPWCGWSRRLAPTWHHTAKLVSHKSYGYNTKIAQVDCTDPTAVRLCRRQHIAAFPTVKVFREGATESHEFYQGDRTAEAFIRFIEHVRSGMHHEVQKALGQKGRGAVRGTGGAAQGCLLSGFVMVQKVPGSLAIAAHSKFHTIAAEAINTSHKIHHLSFGDLPPKRSSGILAGAFETANRLGGSYWRTSASNHTHEHYIKVVNTVYTGKSTDYTTYKYTVNSHEYEDGLNYASAKFTYDISPMSVVIASQQIPFYHFVTSLCAIIGGVFTVLGLLDSALFAGYQSIRTKIQLGKNR